MLHSALIGWMFFGPSAGRPARPAAQKHLPAVDRAEREEAGLVQLPRQAAAGIAAGAARHVAAAAHRSEDRPADHRLESKARRQIETDGLSAGASARVGPRRTEAPNLFAFAVPKLPPPAPKPAAKLFAPPPEVMRAITPPEPLPDAPEVSGGHGKAGIAASPARCPNRSRKLSCRRRRRSVRPRRRRLFRMRRR